MKTKKTVLHEITDCGRDPSERADCSVRALAHALNIPYGEAHARVKAEGRKDRNGFSFRKFAKSLSSLGLETRADLSCMTLFRALPEMQQGRFVCRVSHHFFAVVDGKVLDTWEQKPGRKLKMVYQPINDVKTKLAPAVFHAMQPGFGHQPDIELYNLTADVPGHRKGSTVGRRTLERLGFTVPARTEGV